ncbi:tripartite tricarboxylate transporter TctB family protein [Amorphus sp. 3PC139-8]|uniref:tripartite tricarboxylate transporter TctB family protein n=1 Tax=Amorphus sp. 3PC139-8 TaxID=2735676 RepID=UPI00345C6A0B
MSDTDGADTSSRAGMSWAGDALATLIGLAALGLMVTAKSHVDVSGPDPFYKGPLIFPLIALAITAAGAVPAAARLLRAPRSASQAIRVRLPPRPLLLFVLACFYAPAIAVAGLDASTFAFLFAGLLLAGYLKPLRALLTAAIVTLLMHLAFITVLDIWFPAPTLWSAFGGA